ncbi:ARM repeat-containing protein, partial [Hanseniaspora valbyensis NRRL Y-1626]
NRGKLLAFQVRALASLIPFMDLELTTIYGNQVIDIITKEMNSSVIDMHLTILISIQRLLEAQKFMELNEFKEKLFDPFFTKFWTRQISLTGGKILKAVLFTTSMIAQKAGLIYVIERLVEHLKDKLESLRVMSVSVITRVLKDTPENIVILPPNLEERLVDSLLIAFQEQKTGTNVFVKCFITLSEKLSKRLESYLLPIISTGLNMMSNNNQLLRRNAAELCASMTHICADLGQKELVSKLGAVFYENLGEPIGDVLQHVVRCLAEVVRYTEDLKKLQPPITQLLPTLTPILKNPHIGVCKNLLDLVGQISKRCSDVIPPREWNRVCNELLEIFKSPLKDIRVQANDTFGIIAEGVGPQEIIITLLNNLKMSERQIRLCSSIAMAIIAKACGTFTILPVLMNEYKTPDTNIKNGILKALAFMFEYIGEDCINYVYHMVPMLEHALTDRNIVLRQTASTVVKSLAVSCKSCDREDAFIHFLNLLIPNIFETSPHAIERMRSAITSLRVTIGTDILMQYIWAGLTHPSTTVKESYFAVFNIIKEEEEERLVRCYPLNEVEELINVI